MAATTYAGVIKRVECLETQHEEVDKWINGNGKEGAKVSMARMADHMDTIDKRLSKIEATLDRLFWGVVVVVGVGFISYLITDLIPSIIAHMGSK